MSDYPTPPPVDFPEIQASSNSNDSSRPAYAGDAKSISPELPSWWWLWLIGATTIGALGLQSWSLLEILGIEKREAQFVARVEAWEASGDDRERTLTAWHDLQSNVDANVDRLRKQTAELEGSLESLRTKRDQLSKEASAEQSLLATLVERKELINQSLDSAKLAMQRLDGDKAGLEQQNQLSDDKNKKLQREITQNEERLKTLEIQVSSQQKLVESQSQKLKDSEQQIGTLQEYLQNRTTEAAKVKIAIRTLAQTQQENETATAKRDKLRKEIAAAEATIESLKSDIDDATKKYTGAESNATRLQKQLDDLKSQEQAISIRIAEMTSSMSKMSTEAAETLKSLIEKATEVSKAVEQLRIAKPKDEVEVDTGEQ